MKEWRRRWSWFIGISVESKQRITFHWFYVRTCTLDMHAYLHFLIDNKIIQEIPNTPEEMREKKNKGYYFMWRRRSDNIIIMHAMLCTLSVMPVAVCVIQRLIVDKNEAVMVIVSDGRHGVWRSYIEIALHYHQPITYEENYEICYSLFYRLYSATTLYRNTHYSFLWL